MTWKIIGHLDAGTSFFGDRRRGEYMHGPHPRKLWVGPHVVKGYRKHKPAVAPFTRDRDTTRARDERHALEYARWLAERDGSTIPQVRDTRVVWSTMYSAHRKTRRKFWNGVREVEASELRIEAVEWGHDRELYNKRKDGKRGAYCGKEWVCEFRIELPNWDFDPREPVLEELPDVAADDDDAWLFSDAA